jgi:dUTP pyrophosphatase
MKIYIVIQREMNNMMMTNLDDIKLTVYKGFVDKNKAKDFRENQLEHVEDVDILACEVVDFEYKEEETTDYSKGIDATGTYVHTVADSNWVQGYYDFSVNPSTKLKIKKLNDNAIIPTQSHEGDACFDLYASENITLRYGVTTMIPTALAMEIPEGYEGVIRPRSSVNKKGIHVFLGTVDSGYRGEVKVMATLIAHQRYDNERNPIQEQTISVIQGERIGQLALRWVPLFEMVESDELSDTDRGEKGFGSSGK